MFVWLNINYLMGLVYAEITLINGADLVIAKKHIIGDQEVKHLTSNMLVDTGSYYLCINETIQEQLGLEFIETKRAVNGWQHGKIRCSWPG